MVEKSGSILCCSEFLFEIFVERVGLVVVDCLGVCFLWYRKKRFFLMPVDCWIIWRGYQCEEGVGSGG